jgi:hypothetical protein
MFITGSIYLAEYGQVFAAEREKPCFSAVGLQSRQGYLRIQHPIFQNKTALSQ